MESLIELLWAYVLVFVFAATPFFEVVIVIPIAILAGLPIIPVTIVALLGNLITVYLVIMFVQAIKNWRNRRKSKSTEGAEDKPSKRKERAKKIWNKYGLPGLAIIGPFFVGSHLTAFMSITLGGSKKATAVWMTISLLFWTIAMAAFTYFGIDLLNINPEESWLYDLFNRS